MKTERRKIQSITLCKEALDYIKERAQSEGRTVSSMTERIILETKKKQNEKI